jgi:hypothetical protein
MTQLAESKEQGFPHCDTSFSSSLTRLPLLSANYYLLFALCSTEVAGTHFPAVSVLLDSPPASLASICSTE